ncbi:Gp1ba, partial [Symbiodinium pilosum]
PCTSRHPNVFCEARDLLVNGAGLAFATRGVGVNELEVAKCEDGNPKIWKTPDHSPAGMHMPVDCGVPYPIWRGVGQQCGFCRVQVHWKASDSYRSCDGYCKAQGGIACEKAFIGSAGDCDTRSTIKCSDSIVNVDAMCQCAAPKVKESAANLKYAAALPRPAEADMQCLEEVDSGCGSLKDKKSCLGSRDGGMESLRGLQVYGEPCVWCGGGLCTDHSSSLCVAYDFVANGLGLAFGARAPAAVSEVASCTKQAHDEMLGAAAPPVPAMAKAGTQSQSESPVGPEAVCGVHPKCSKLDGYCCPNSAGVFLDCCNSNGPMAIADQATLQAQLPATAVHVVVPKVAAPVVVAPQELPKLKYMDHVPDPVPPKVPEPILGVGTWKPPRPDQADLGCMLEEPKGCGSLDDRNAVFDDLQCLKRSEIGCNNIKDKNQCLSSMDARPFDEVAGFKARNQPCVWCGGGSCHSNNANACEPYDFVMNGAGTENQHTTCFHFAAA